MPDIDGATIKITLEAPEAMFLAPPADAMAGRFDTPVGMDQLLRATAMMPRGHRRSAQVVVNLPASTLNSIEADVLPKRIAGYARSKVTAIAQELAQSQREGWRALRLGLVFLAACLALSTAAGNLEILPDFLQRVLSEGFNIAGWVGLWRPIELLLYDNWSIRRDLRLYHAIETMDVRVVSSPTAPAATATTAP